MTSTSSNFIGVRELNERLGWATLIDVRFTPGQAGGRERYSTSHIPGAHYVSLTDVLADPELKTGGSNPLPRPDKLEAELRALGIHNGTEVVVYDDTTGAPAARAWWILRWAGVENVRVLKGGIAAWISGGYPTSTEEADLPARGDFEIRPGSMPSIDANGVAASSARLVDTRPSEQFSGLGLAGGGHIPGAVNVPLSVWTEEMDRGVPEVVELLAAHDVDTSEPIVVYCGGGVSSAYAVLALEEAGVQATLYPGSFSDWTGDPSRKVERSE